ncbi:MAG TPA: AhpC/TSA family protein [Bacteroidia bacterium]|jgi:hypothetical protein|nr:AhpC/TSA family protein [Bacteroidia bacterium]
MNKYFRYLFVLIVWCCTTYVVADVFISYDIKYSMPTPIPLGYKYKSTGTDVKIGGLLSQISNNKPIFIHFYNPDCPCSRFNVYAFQRLEKKYHDKICFVVVVLSNGDLDKLEHARHVFSNDIPVMADNKLAAECGVYSSPQAVLISTDNKLFFRGNYNSNRYCTNSSSFFPELAIKSYLKGDDQALLPDNAYVAYGCSIPENRK